MNEQLITQALQALTAVLLTMGGFLIKRLFSVVDRMEERVVKHEGRIAFLEGKQNAA